MEAREHEMKQTLREEDEEMRVKFKQLMSKWPTQVGRGVWEPGRKRGRRRRGGRAEREWTFECWLEHSVKPS